MDPKIKTGLIIFFVFLFLAIVAYFLTKFLRPNPGEIIQDQASKDRLTTLNNVMISYFGQYWKFLFMAISIIIFLFIFVLYYISQIDVANCSDATLAQIKHFWIVSMIIISLFIIALAFIIVVQVKEYINKLGGDFIFQQNIVEILQLVFYIIGLLLLGWAFFYFERRLFPKS